MDFPYQDLYVTKPTIYKGVLYRSRLEAKWAYVFDKCGFEYQYEPRSMINGGNMWTPDFLIKKDGFEYWVEVKPIWQNAGLDYRVHRGEVYQTPSDFVWDFFIQMDEFQVVRPLVAGKDGWLYTSELRAENTAWQIDWDIWMEASNAVRGLPHTNHPITPSNSIYQLCQL